MLSPIIICVYNTIKAYQFVSTAKIRHFTELSNKNPPFKGYNAPSL